MTTLIIIIVVVLAVLILGRGKDRGLLYFGFDR